MIFNSFTYVLFLGLVVVLCWSLRGVRAQNRFLLVASYVFYAAWDWRFLGLIVLTTTIDYLAAHAMPDATPRRKRLLLFASLIANLGALGFFKYFNFFVDSAVGLLRGLGIPADPFVLQIILPIGISFYTLKALSYTIEVYRGNLAPTHSWVNYALFVSFFPELAAGPIDRAARLLPQIEQPRTIDGERFESGLALILLGMVKKIVIADVAASLIDPAVFAEPSQFAGGDVLLGVYLFAVQLYADFSGYTDIARGSARLLGFEPVENFAQPYLSPNIADFWRRWHISLSTWLRDYIFFPFSRAMLRRSKGKNPQAIMVASNMLTMTVSGLWHGANWTYILWGVLHGIFLSVHRLLLNRRILPVKFGAPSLSRLWYILSILFTFHLVLLAWVPFRAPSIELTFSAYQQIGGIILGGGGDLQTTVFIPTVLLYAAMLGIDLAQIATRETIFTLRLPAAARTALYTLGILAMVFFSVKPYVPFIYFQF